MKILEEFAGIEKDSLLLHLTTNEYHDGKSSQNRAKRLSERS